MKKQKEILEDSSSEIKNKQTDNSAENQEESELLSGETEESTTQENITDNIDTEGVVATVPSKSFRERMDDVYSYLGGFFKRNNLIQRFAGIFLIFISFVTWKNNSLDYKINFSYMWKEYSESISIGKMVIIVGGIFVVLTLLKEFVVKLRKINYDSYIFIGGLFLFGVTSLWRCVDFYLIIAITIVCVVLVNSFTKHTDFNIIRKKSPSS